MLKNPFQVAITFSLVVLCVKLIIFSLGAQHGDMERYLIYIYMLILLLAVFFGIRSNKINNPNPPTFGEDFKSGARTASFFGILVAVITFVYYSQIDADFFEIKKQPLFEKLAVDAKEKAASMDKTELTAFLSNQILGINMYLSPYFQAMWTMFGLVFMGLFYALVFTFMMRKVPGFK